MERFLSEPDPFPYGRTLVSPQIGAT